MTSDNSKKSKYTQEEKDGFLARLFPPESISLGELSRESGISKSTLATWKQKDISCNNSEKYSKQRMPGVKDKFLIVMETYTLSEAELSRYCRRKGLYVEDVKKWQDLCLEANNGHDVEVVDVKGLRLKQLEDTKKIKELEKDLCLKEKALAETVSLLVLRKKLQAIFVEKEED